MERALEADQAGLSKLREQGPTRSGKSQSEVLDEIGVPWVTDPQVGVIVTWVEGEGEGKWVGAGGGTVKLAEE